MRVFVAEKEVKFDIILDTTIVFNLNKGYQLIIYKKDLKCVH